MLKRSASSFPLSSDCTIITCVLGPSLVSLPVDAYDLILANIGTSTIDETGGKNLLPTRQVRACDYAQRYLMETCRGLENFFRLKTMKEVVLGQWGTTDATKDKENPDVLARFLARWQHVETLTFNFGSVLPTLALCFAWIEDCVLISNLSRSKYLTKRGI